ncbi:MAG: hypothetical protein ACYDDF_10750 [Thermoplasmatota archaeon]
MTEDERKERGIGKIEELVASLERSLPALPDDVGLYLVAVAVVREGEETQYVARELPANCKDDDVAEIRRGILRDVVTA